MKYISKIFILVLIITFLNSCNNENHIDKYDVNIDSLKTLPNNFYAYRGGSVFIENWEYRIWFKLNSSGNIENVSNVQDYANYKGDKLTAIKKYKIDTVKIKTIAQKFIKLSRKFKFGHIKIDKENKIYFSSRKEPIEQYVMILNDSLKKVYYKNKDFRLLKNGWFENKKK